MFENELQFEPKVPKTVPSALTKILELSMKYSDPKLYIPLNKSGKTCLKKPWYVYFYYEDPETGTRGPNNKFIKKHGINRFKTITERKEFGRRVVKVYEELLSDGWNPYENKLVVKNQLDFTVKETTLSDAIEKALKVKKETLKSSSYEDLIWRLKRFLRFAKKHNFDTISSNAVTRMHVVHFLDARKKAGENGTSINNYRASLSSIFSQMVQNGHLETNFVRDIRKLKSTPVKNHPFTKLQIEDIQKYLKKEDPLLLNYIRVLGYSFLRNNEVATLKISDIDLRYNQITARDTKTKAIDKVYIIEPLYKLFKEMRIEDYPKHYSLFSPTGEPAEWTSTPGSKSNFFSKRFRKVKKHFRFGAEYGIYSFRHSFAVHLLDTFMKRGMAYNEAVNKMLPITRHESPQALENYLREKKNMLPKDYSLDIEGMGL